MPRLCVYLPTLLFFDTLIDYFSIYVPIKAFHYLPKTNRFAMSTQKRFAMSTQKINTNYRGVEKF